MVRILILVPTGLWVHFLPVWVRPILRQAATGTAWFKVPSAIRFILKGKKAPWVSGKDVILHIIGKIGVDGALYRSMEFTGPGVSELSIDDRFAICSGIGN